MKKQSWSLTTLQNGKPAETFHDLSRREAIEAVRAAMYGYDFERLDTRTRGAEHAEERLAA